MFGARMRPIRILSALALLTFATANAFPQSTATYHLHKASNTSFQLVTTGLGTAAAVQSANLKNLTSYQLVKEYDTVVGVPGQSGALAAGSTVTFSLVMKKSVVGGTMYPDARL